MPHDTVRVSGQFVVEVIRDRGFGPEVIDRRVASNLIMNTGKRQTWRQAAGLSANIWNQMRIGTSGAAATSGGTNLLSPVTGTLETVGSITISVGRTLQLVHSYASGVGSKSASIAEVAILNQNATPGGSALCRCVINPAVPKTTTDKLKIIYTARIN